MAISLNWINDYVDIKNEDKVELANKITKAGINVEKVIVNNIKNLVVGEILECEMHPDSDHLHVCKVNIGSEVTQIVCGASNVKSGIKVIVALPGAILPGEFEIKKSKIRGVESNGMICALFELGLEEKTEENYNKGICELSENALVGEDAFEYLGYGDTSYELDLNPNRTDCNNHLCFAYEVAAVLKKQVTMPDITFSESSESIDGMINLEVDTENVPMYNLMIAKDVKIKESPDFIKKRLEIAGVRSINNVVDISNYVMLEYGQPLHFFDKDIVGDKIVVRMANDEEKIITLDKQERILKSDDIVITDGDKVLCVAGVMGGFDSGINDDTKNILIESALFNPYNIRYTSLRLGLRSEASLRFEKPLSHEYCELAIQRACHLLEKYADAKIVSGCVSYDCVDKTLKKINVSLTEINSILGMSLTAQDVESTLDSLGFTYEVNNNQYEVTVPNRRQDIVLQKEDIIEEVGRLYGYDNIVPTLPVVNIKQGEYSESAKFRKIVSKRMRSLGFNEVRTYTLVNQDDANKYNYNFGDIIKLNRPMLKERSYIRQSLLTALVDVAKYNISKNNKDILLYEIANVYSGSEEYIEDTKLAFVLSGNYLTNTWNSNAYEMDFYFTKGIVENLLSFLGFDNRYSLKLNNNLLKEIHPKINSEIIVGGKSVGYFGKLHPSIAKEDMYVCEISLTKLNANKTSDIKYQELNKYPKVEKDLAFIVDDNIESIEILKEIKKVGGKLLTEVKVFDVYKGDKIDSNKKSIAYNLIFEDNTRTLTEGEVMNIFSNIIKVIETKFNARLRDK
ncbi:MAG: phenylalanine--tRNA ligase subunit beta [Firmicutes bacterium]|nr:phenylalanine--tRNA ligase subunit beta [Bacillota bacterium]